MAEPIDEMERWINVLMKRRQRDVLSPEYAEMMLDIEHARATITMVKDIKLALESLAQVEASRARVEAERAKAEAERTKAEASRVQIEAERAKTEASRALVEAERARSEEAHRERALADAQRASDDLRMFQWLSVGIGVFAVVMAGAQVLVAVLK